MKRFLKTTNKINSTVLQYSISEMLEHQLDK